MMIIYHKHLTPKMWKSLPFVEQMANIGSEVIRALSWKQKNRSVGDTALYRALELIDLTRSIDRKLPHLLELGRIREAFIDHYCDFHTYKTTRSSWEKYFFQFTYAAQLKRMKHEFRFICHPDRSVR